VSFQSFLLTLSKTAAILNVIIPWNLPSSFMLIKSERKSHNRRVLKHQYLENVSFESSFDHDILHTE
jgi:hypothetical protein